MSTHAEIIAPTRVAKLASALCDAVDRVASGVGLDHHDAPVVAEAVALLSAPVADWGQAASPRQILRSEYEVSGFVSLAQVAVEQLGTGSSPQGLAEDIHAAVNGDREAASRLGPVLSRIAVLADRRA